MDSKASPAPLSTDSKISIQSKPRKDRDFLNHLEVYLAKRDGVDKLLKISRYATKIILAAAVVPESLPLNRRLKSFESSVGLSRKAFRLGKFVQDVNALRNSQSDSTPDFVLNVLAYGGEGLYYFVEQFIWLSKSGLIDGKHAKDLQKVSAWAEFIGYIGSISIKVIYLNRILKEEARLEDKTIKASNSNVNGDGSLEEEEETKRKVREKKLMKKLSIVQDLADALMAVADIRDGKGPLATPLVLSCAGLLSAIISTHKNWVSC